MTTVEHTPHPTGNDPRAPDTPPEHPPEHPPESPAPSPLRLSVIVPIYNEAATIDAAIARLDTAPLPPGLTREIILIDDGSTDGSRDHLTDLARDRDDIILIMHPRNMGKGAAVRSGFQRARGDILLIHDADLEYDPCDHPAILAPILDGRADAVIGSRFLGQTHRVLYYWHAVANRIITTLSNMLTNLNLTDIECCTKAMTRTVAQQITIRENRFGVEPELIARIARTRIDGRTVRIYEAPVSYAGRTYAEGKKITWRDGLHAIGCILRYGLFDRR